MAMQAGPHMDLMTEALRLEAVAQRALLEGDLTASQAGYREAADRYRRSWELAPPRSYGRLVGHLKAAILAGEPGEAADYVSGALGGSVDSPASAYALALAALVHGDDALAAHTARQMRGDSEAFERTADAITAIAERDGGAYAAALGKIVHSFETRDLHLTGVPIADTAVMLQRLAQERGVAADPGPSPVLPPA